MCVKCSAFLRTRKHFGFLCVTGIHVGISVTLINKHCTKGPMRNLPAQQSQEKQKLRQKILQARECLSLRDVEEKSKKIVYTLTGLPAYTQADIICIYISTRNEVRTHRVIQQLLRESKKKVVVPVMFDEQIKLAELERWEDLMPGAYGILEPARRKMVANDQIQLVIVPGVVFDVTGHRIGYGKGYYDRFLSSAHVPKIGLAYELQIVENVPAHSEDVPVDCIVTEERVIWRKP